MKKEILKIKDRDHLIFSDEDPEFIILEVVGKEEAETLEKVSVKEPERRLIP